MLYSFMHDFQTCKINFYAEYLVSGNLSRSCLDGFIPNYRLVGVLARLRIPSGCVNSKIEDQLSTILNLVTLTSLLSETEWKDFLKL